MSFAQKTAERSTQRTPISRPAPVVADKGVSWFAIGTVATAIVAVPIAMIAMTAIENLDFSSTGSTKPLTEEELIVEAMNTELAKIDMSAEADKLVGASQSAMALGAMVSPKDQQWLKMSATAMNSPLIKMNIRAALNSKSGRCGRFIRTNGKASRTQVASFARHVETIRNSGATPDPADIAKLRLMRASVGCQEYEKGLAEKRKSRAKTARTRTTVSSGRAGSYYPMAVAGCGARVPKAMSGQTKPCRK